MAATQPSDSFVHLHAVVDLPPGLHASQLPVHSYFLAAGMVGDTGWPTLTIGTAVDDTLGPPGKMVLVLFDQLRSLRILCCCSWTAESCAWDGGVLAAPYKLDRQLP